MALLLLAFTPREAKSQGSKTGRTIEVGVTYKGAGTADETHPICVSLWDSAAVVQEGSR
jgi:hypothetical protein